MLHKCFCTLLQICPVSVCRQFLGFDTLFFSLACTANYRTLCRQVCGSVSKSVQLTKMTTGGVQSICRNIWWVISGVRKHLSAMAKNVNVRIFYIFVFYFSYIYNNFFLVFTSYLFYLLKLLNRFWNKAVTWQNVEQMKWTVNTFQMHRTLVANGVSKASFYRLPGRYPLDNIYAAYNKYIPKCQSCADCHEKKNLIKKIHSSSFIMNSSILRHQAGEHMSQLCRFMCTVNVSSVRWQAYLLVITEKKLLSVLIIILGLLYS